MYATDRILLHVTSISPENVAENQVVGQGQAQKCRAIKVITCSISCLLNII